MSQMNNETKPPKRVSWSELEKCIINKAILKVPCNILESYLSLMKEAFDVNLGYIDYLKAENERLENSIANHKKVIEIMSTCTTYKCEHCKARIKELEK